MGRLFWKFFFAILFAQLVTTFGVGATLWVWGQARGDAAAASARGAIDRGPMAVALVDAAALVLRHGGVKALDELTASASGARLYAVDANGQDLFGRPVSAALRAEMAHLQAAGGADAVRRLEHGTASLTVFVVRSGGPRFGAPPNMFGPPGPGPGAASGHRLPYITMVVGTLATLLFAALLAWYFSRPIRALRGAFEAAASGNLAPRFDSARRGRGDELAELGHDFDRMSGQLRALMDNQRRLLHDVSHELRSPLARLQAAIGLAHQRPDTLAASLERIERESVRMDKLVGELLTLSRLESPSALPALERIALQELVEEIADDARFEAAAHGRLVVVAGLCGAHVRGAPDLLWRAVENVVRNAVKHSAHGSTVQIVLSARDHLVSIEVLDRGPGVAEGELEAIFAPFFRSGACANSVDGHGLGLAIARRVIAAHGGVIDAQNRDGGGLCVRMVLPVASEAR